MTCKDFRDHLIDLATAHEGPVEARAHVDACAGCAAELASFRQTMAMLDEWAAPADTSPYFMTRLRARVREEQAPARGWLSWFRNPALAVAMMVIMVLSIGLMRLGSPSEAKPPVIAAKGTPVGDLQYLDKNHDLLADFEMLDGLEQN
ncbi:MAG TPA: hypothetical protein VII81_05655 [Terriglobales bacterium]